MTTANRPPVPNLFRLYALEQLTELIPYTETYLVELKRRPDRINPRFRATCAAILGRSEDELFACDLSSAAASSEAASTQDPGSPE